MERDQFFVDGAQRRVLRRADALFNFRQQRGVISDASACSGYFFSGSFVRRFLCPIDYVVSLILV